MKRYYEILSSLAVNSKVEYKNLKIDDNELMLKVFELENERYISQGRSFNSDGRYAGHEASLTLRGIELLTKLKENINAQSRWGKVKSGFWFVLPFIIATLLSFALELYKFYYLTPLQVFK